MTDNHALFQVNKTLNQRCRERASLYLSRLDTWTMNGCFTLGVCGKFIKAFMLWMDTKCYQVDHGVTFVTEIKHSKMKIRFSKTASNRYLCQVNIVPVDYFVNPWCSENGAIVIAQNMSTNRSYDAYIKSFNMILPYLTALKAYSSMTTDIWMDGKNYQSPDLRLIESISGQQTYSKYHMAHIVYRLLVAFSRETTVGITSHTPHMEESHYGYDLLRRFVQ